MRSSRNRFACSAGRQLDICRWALSRPDSSTSASMGSAAAISIEKGAPFEGEVSVHRSHQVSDEADEVYITITSFFV